MLDGVRRHVSNNLAQATVRFLKAKVKVMQEDINELNTEIKVGLAVSCYHHALPLLTFYSVYSAV